MRSFHCWQASGIAVLAAVFFSCAHPAHSAEPLPEGGAKSTKTAAKKKAAKLRFQFRYQPWKDVLDWFAQQADLSLVIPATMPPGTFNYSDNREYTPAEAIDVLNRVLQTNGFLLVRNDRMLIVVNTEDPIPAYLVEKAPVESLDSRGESELLNVQFKLIKIRPEDIEAEVKKLLGPPGSVVALAKSQELSVTDTAGRLRTVRDYLKSIEGPDGTVSGGLKTFRLRHTRPDDVLPILRQLLEIPEDKIAATDGSIRVAQEAGTDRLLISGRPDKVARASEIIEKLEGPTAGAADAPAERSHIRTLPMSDESARAALQRIEQIWPAMRPNPVRVVSPPGGGSSTPATDDSAAPPRELPARPQESRPSREPDRAWPLRDERPADPPRWPGQTPPPPKPRHGPAAGPAARVTMAAEGRPDKLFGARILCVADPLPAKAAEGKPPAGTDQVQAPGAPGRPDAQPGKNQARAPGIPGRPDVQEGKPPAPIIVIPGPNGLTITSEDLDALDAFERLLTTAGGSGSGPMKVFFLKYAKAQDVAEELEKFLASGSSGAEGASGHKALVTGPVKITPEPRLNALMVLANRADQDTVEQLLKKLFDLKEPPDPSEVAPKPRMIPVVHARAKDVAEVLRQVYADRLVLTLGQELQQTRAAGRGAGLAMLMGGMAGGFGGGDGGGRGAGGRGQGGQNQANRIAIGVDARTNTLIVAATDPMFEEVKQLVQELDVGDETVRVVTLHGTSAAAVQKALTAFGGDAVQTNTPTTAGNANNTAATSPWAARGGFGRTNGWNPGGWNPGGNSPFQGGGRGGWRNFQQGGPGQ